MIKNILIIVLLVLTILFGMFALYQRDKAGRMRAQAIEAEQKAKEMQRRMMDEILRNEICEGSVDSLKSALRSMKHR